MSDEGKHVASLRGLDWVNFFMADVNTGIGPFLSNYLAGLVVKHLGYNTGFLGLTGIAIVGLAVFAVFMPETKDAAKASSLEIRFRVYHNC